MVARVSDRFQQERRSKEQTKPKFSSFTSLSRLFVLEFDLASGTGFETDKHRAHLTLTDFEDHRLLPARLICIADGEEMGMFLGEEEERRNQDRFQIAAIYALAVL